MKIKTYKYEYNWGDASAHLEIDTEKLSEGDAKMLLEFFSWDWDVEENIYDELGRLYCRTAMCFATTNVHNLRGVLSDFKDAEGFPEVDGTYGIKLIQVSGIDFSELEMDKKT